MVKEVGVSPSAVTVVLPKNGDGTETEEVLDQDKSKGAVANYEPANGEVAINSDQGGVLKDQPEANFFNCMRIPAASAEELATYTQETDLILKKGEKYTPNVRSGIYISSESLERIHEIESAEAKKKSETDPAKVSGLNDSEPVANNNQEEFYGPFKPVESETKNTQVTTEVPEDSSKEAKATVEASASSEAEEKASNTEVPEKVEAAETNVAKTTEHDKSKPLLTLEIGVPNANKAETKFASEFLKQTAEVAKESGKGFLGSFAIVPIAVGIVLIPILGSAAYHFLPFDEADKNWFSEKVRELTNLGDTPEEILKSFNDKMPEIARIKDHRQRREALESTLSSRFYRLMRKQGVEVSIDWQNPRVSIYENGRLNKLARYSDKGVIVAQFTWDDKCTTVKSMNLKLQTVEDFEDMLKYVNQAASSQKTNIRTFKTMFKDPNATKVSQKKTNKQNAQKLNKSNKLKNNQTYYNAQRKNQSLKDKSVNHK